MTSYLAGIVLGAIAVVPLVVDAVRVRRRYLAVLDTRASAVAVVDRPEDEGESP